MSFFTMADNGIDILAKRDGALYNSALAGKSFIIQGIGNEMALSASGLNVTVASGEAVLHGRHVSSDAPNVLAVPANSSGFVVLRLDLSRTLGNESYLFTTPVLTQQEVNGAGTIYDLELASFTSTGSGVQLTDIRKVMDTPFGDQVIYEYDAMTKTLNIVTL